MANRYPVEMPPIDVAQHILDYLWEVGPTAPSGFAATAIGHDAIRAWQDNVGIDLDAWEARLLRRLSTAYAQECNAAAQHDRPAPWRAELLGKVFATINMRKSINEMKEL